MFFYRRLVSPSWHLKREPDFVMSITDHVLAGGSSRLVFPFLLCAGAETSSRQCLHDWCLKSLNLHPGLLPQPQPTAQSYA